MTRGVCLIAYGAKAEHEAHECIVSLRQHHAWPYIIIGSVARASWKTIEQLPDADNICKSRWAKVTLNQWSPFTETLYIDADTRVQGDLTAGFEMLDDGFDMVITPSASQGRENMWHILQDEREATYEAYQCGSILQLQGGVFWFRKSITMDNFFEAWRREWLRFKQFDQAALLRALHVAPVRLHLLGRPFNGGAVVQHWHGRAVK